MSYFLYELSIKSAFLFFRTFNRRLSNRSYSRLLLELNSITLIKTAYIHKVIYFYYCYPNLNISSELLGDRKVFPFLSIFKKRYKSLVKRKTSESFQRPEVLLSRLQTAA